MQSMHTAEFVGGYQLKLMGGSVFYAFLLIVYGDKFRIILF